VILGDGGHARALLDWPINIKPPPDQDVLLVGEGEDVPSGDPVLIGVGTLPRRRELYEEYKNRTPDGGRQYMRGAIVYGSAVVGKNVLVNTGAQIDHDCMIGDHCIISPGAILCGSVTLGEECQIGAGATILEGVELSAGTKVPAGTLVVAADDMRRP